MIVIEVKKRACTFYSHGRRLKPSAVRVTELNAQRVYTVTGTCHLWHY